MFVERRQRVTGIDKSYPLQPISKSTPVNSTRQKVTVSGVTEVFWRSTYYWILDGIQETFNENYGIISIKTHLSFIFFKNEPTKFIFGSIPSK